MLEEQFRISIMKQDKGGWILGHPHPTEGPFSASLSKDPNRMWTSATQLLSS